jgi:simple sugar transport system permease protein
VIFAMRAGVLRAAEALLVPASALAGALLLFGVFVWFEGKDPLEVYAVLYRGGFGSGFSWQNTLSRAAPLILTALCVALPAQVGLMVIGGEGALVLGGLAAAIAGAALNGIAPWMVSAGMCLAGMIAGGLWIMLAGALRHYRGVNETISSLLLTYIALALFNHLVEGPLRDPSSLNKPSTRPVGDINMLGNLPGLHVHWGLGFGVIACLLCAIWIYGTTSGFALRMVGGNPRAGQLAGLASGQLILAACAAAGAAAGLAGAAEVAAVHGAANASLIAGYGYAGILVAFIARQNPLGIIPVALLVGGISASGGMLQRRLDMPDASVAVLEGIAFILILASESWSGKWAWFKFAAARPALAPRAVDAPTTSEAAS